MMSVTEKVAYLKGLTEGLDVDVSTKEGKLLKAIVDVLGDVAESLDGLQDYTDELTEQVDSIDEDLDTLENDYYGEDDEDDEDEDADEDGFYDVVCPNCNEEFSVDEETLLDGNVECPKCGEKLEFDIDEDDDCCCDDECSCGCHGSKEDGDDEEKF